MNVAIVGASGAVGQEFMRVLDEQRDVSRGVMGYVVLASVVVLAFVVKVLINNGMHLPGVRFVALVALFYAGMAALMLWARGKMSLRWLKVAAVVCTVAQMCAKKQDFSHCFLIQ